MKNLHLLKIFILVLFFSSCSTDSIETELPLTENPGLTATLNGGTFNDYEFTDGTYLINLGTNGNTMAIDVADANGNQVTLFLNGTNGFNSGTIKAMGDIDANNFVTYTLIRQANPQLSYHSSAGDVVITENRAHPTEEGLQLISGTFNITTNTLDSTNTTVFTGSFTNLAYQN